MVINKYKAIFELTKPRITLMVVITAIGGFFLGSSSPINWTLLAHTAMGVALLSSGLSTLNQYYERFSDGLMDRTKTRPLPSGVLSSNTALIIGIALSVSSEIYLYKYANLLTALLGFVAFVGYLFVYTPLKTRSSWCTFIGAIPGAMPPLLGWAAATNTITIEALILFGILFLWQFPHFHAIALLYSDDYAKAKIKMLPVVEPDGESTAREIKWYTFALVVVSLLPKMFDFAGWIYFIGATLLGTAFLYIALKTANDMSRTQSKTLLKASVIYLPLILGLLVINNLF